MNFCDAISLEREKDALEEGLFFKREPTMKEFRKVTLSKNDVHIQSFSSFSTKLSSNLTFKYCIRMSLKNSIG